MAIKIIVRHPGEVQIGALDFPCALGRGGIGDKKGEGDGITPIGTFPLRCVYYRPDRLPHPQTGLPVFKLSETDGWCDEPDHPKYNQLVKTPFAASHENLWRDDNVYDLIIPLGYNDNPILAGQGSAIFMHIAQPDFTPTEGCVAMNKADLLEILRQSDKKTEIEVVRPHK